MLSHKVAPAKILLVDDQPTVIHQLNGIFRDLAEIFFATNGHTALEMVALHKPDLVLLDVEMPDLNGFDVCRAIRSSSANHPTSIIFITSHNDPESEVMALSVGGVDFIPKPIVPEVARARVKNHLALILKRKQLEDEKERIRITLNSIGDAVIATDTSGMVTLVNPVAEDLTGWRAQDAIGKPIETVMHLIDGETGRVLQNPIRIALREKRIVGMALNTCISKGLNKSLGVEDSAAPIIDKDGNLTGAIIVFHDVSEARAMAVKMTHLAQHDALTDLPNRILLYDRAQQALNQSRRDQSMVAMLLLDIDHFKEVNDLHGHLVGDLFIQQIAHALSKEVRDGDTVCRQGGDEFIFLLTNVDSLSAVTHISERLLSIISQPWTHGDISLRLSATIGISLFPNDAYDLETLYRHADAAMYSAKRSGRNQYHFYNQEIESKLVLRRTLENNLLSAMANNVFEVFYQPKVNLTNNSIIGAEALVRWRQPDGSLTAPMDFIPLAEETGLIVPLGKIILKQAFQQTILWQREGFNISVAVNISVAQFEDSSFLTILDDLISETGVSPENIELEITESLLAKDSEKLNNTFSSLKERGFQIALDDFGTGYSSLAYLKNYPFDVLKIDQTFVRNMQGSTTDQSIVRAIVQLAEGMNLRLVAEGVETIDHVNSLNSMGCSIMQGFYYSKPVPIEEFNLLLRLRMSEPNPKLRNG